MGGKFLSGAGALFLVVFGVALTEYWKSEFVQGIIQFVLNIPTMLVAPVGVQLWLVIIAALFIAGVVIRAAVIATNQKFERQKPTEPVPVSMAQLMPVLASNVTSEQKQVLAFLANVMEFEKSVNLKDIYTSLGLDSLIVDNAVNQLLDDGFLQIHRNYYLGNSVELSPKGKKYVVENGVLQSSGSWGFLEVK
jgi:DNA-binding MarR family transcriptional regulator